MAYSIRDIPHQAWFRHLASVNLGTWPPIRVNINRGVTFSWPISLAGKWEGSSLKAALRTAPDGPVVHNFSVSDPEIQDEYTFYNLTLSKGQTESLFTDPDGDSLVNYVMDVLFTPSGGKEFRLFVALVIVSGEVTDGS